MKIKQLVSVALVGFMFLVSCTTQKGPGNIELTSNNSALKTMETIGLNAKQCWFTNANADFSSYRLEPELVSYSGRPRILIVSRNDPGGRPLLVVEAQGIPTKISVYGALMSGTLGNKIAKSISLWNKGQNQC